jgi:hypothetical protein
MNFEVIDILKVSIKDAFFVQNANINIEDIIVSDDVSVQVLQFHVDHDRTINSRLLTEQLTSIWKDRIFKYDDSKYQLDINTIDIDDVQFLGKSETTITVKYIKLK